MALIQCPECGKMISDMSQMCIGCGCPISFIKKTMKRKNPSSVTSIKEMIEIADDYFWGQNGVEEDTEEAFRWYQRAAEKGDAYAQYSLGYCYMNGEGCDYDEKKAVYFYEKAAEQGWEEAYRPLAECYEDGDGVEKNLETALKWYRAAADDDEEDEDVLRLERLVAEERRKKELHKAEELRRRQEATKKTTSQQERLRQEELNKLIRESKEDEWMDRSGDPSDTYDRYHDMEQQIAARFAWERLTGQDIYINSNYQATRYGDPDKDATRAAEIEEHDDDDDDIFESLYDD